MKFVYADSLDYVDPGYDFLRDRNGNIVASLSYGDSG